MAGARPLTNPVRAVVSFPFRALLFVLLLVKVLLRKLILGIVLALQAAQRHAISAALILALSAALIYTNAVGTPLGRPVGAPGVTPSTSLPPAKVVESYVQGQIKGDATMMWAAMSDDLRQSFAERGGSVQQLQQSIDQAKQAGRIFRRAEYVFGKRLSDGRAIYVYILTGVSPSGETREIPYLFTVNTAGKIESID
jgi:hypothetical protein